jgi:hypothetical protein
MSEAIHRAQLRAEALRLAIEAAQGDPQSDAAIIGRAMTFLRFLEDIAPSELAYPILGQYAAAAARDKKKTSAN